MIDDKVAIIKQIWDTEEDGWGLQIVINLGADIDKIKTAMDEYAKQQAIGFAEWIKKGDWFQDRDGSWNYSAFDSSVRIAESTEKLYELYLKVNKPL